MQWYLVRGELGREESDADDDEEKAVEARAHDEERSPERKGMTEIKMALIVRACMPLSTAGKVLLRWYYLRRSYTGQWLMIVST